MLTWALARPVAAPWRELRQGHSSRVLSDPHTFDPLRRRPLEFSGACEQPTATVNLGFFGDILVHNAPHLQGFAQGFDSLWQPLTPLFQAVDLMYGNLEGTFSKRRTKKSNSRNRMRYDPRLATALADSGFDVLSTANNHACDRGRQAVDDTLDVIERAGMVAVGTRRRSALRPDPPAEYAKFTDVGGLRIAWVACAEWTNSTKCGGQIMHCFRDKKLVIDTVRDLAQRDDVDLVVATPHGGRHLTPRADVVTRAFNRELVEAGASVVVGNYVVQQWEKVTATDGREAFVSTCTGASFTQLKAKKGEMRAGAMLIVGVGRDQTGDVKVRGARHVPLVWSRHGRTSVIEPAEASALGWRARRKVHGVMSSWNESPPLPPLDATPQCRPGYIDPGFALGSDGEPCSVDGDCAPGLRCTKGKRDGVCH
jgi:poly-gamma-glutamate synthesis protein (capsule biosynthesis protein)